MDINKDKSPQFYEVELSTQPLGRRVSTLTTDTITFPDGHRETFTIDQQQSLDQTLKQIAKLHGISKASVIRVLHQTSVPGRFSRNSES